MSRKHIESVENFDKVSQFLVLLVMLKIIKNRKHGIYIDHGVGEYGPGISSALIRDIDKFLEKYLTAY